MSCERTLLHRLLEPDGLAVVFQPIVRYEPDSRSVYAFEALLRGPCGTNMESADVLFEYVRRKHEEIMMDRVCVGRALEEARALPGAPALSLNVHASTLGRDSRFVRYMADAAERLGISHGRLTVEIVEHAPAWEGPGFQRSLAELRAIGARIALDDVGLGQSNYRMIIDCRPDWFKVDRYVVGGAATDPHRRAVLRSVAGLAADFGAETVAEGVETEGDLACVTGLGMRLVQGFLLARPVPATQLGAAPLGRQDSVGPRPAEGARRTA